MLLVYGALVPIVVLAAWAIAFRPAAHKIHVTYLGLVTRYEICVIYVGFVAEELTGWNNSVFLTVFLTDVCLYSSGLYQALWKSLHLKQSLLTFRYHSL